MPENALLSSQTESDESQLFDPRAALWQKCSPIEIDRYWDGRSARCSEHGGSPNLTCVRSAWSPARLFFYFEAHYDQLNINTEWTSEASVHGLWEKDVVELFLRPEAREDYFEIEVSPLGQWLDAHIRKPRIDVNFSWESRLTLRALLEEKEKVWRTFVALPYETLGVAGPPELGLAWHLNLFRIAGQAPRREYLAWRPTFTEVPDFHRPASFGYLFFLES